MRHYLMTFAMLVVPVAAAAQSTATLPQLDAATRVRVWSSDTDGSLKARIQTATPQTLEVSAGAASPRVFHVSDLERVDVSRGRNRWLWTAGGVLVGATAGVLITRADNDEGDIAGGLAETAEGMANTMTGMLVGGIVGFFVAPERWRTVWQK